MRLSEAWQSPDGFFLDLAQLSGPLPLLVVGVSLRMAVPESELWGVGTSSPVLLAAGCGQGGQHLAGS